MLLKRKHRIYKEVLWIADVYHFVVDFELYNYYFIAFSRWYSQVSDNLCITYEYFTTAQNCF